MVALLCESSFPLVLKEETCCSYLKEVGLIQHRVTGSTYQAIIHFLDFLFPFFLSAGLKDFFGTPVHF